VELESRSCRTARVVGITDKLTAPVSFHCVKVLPISQNRLFTNRSRHPL
jgi:hypothetical protein